MEFLEDKQIAELCAEFSAEFVAAYRAMGADKAHEKEAHEWAEGTVSDSSIEECR
jgi:ribosomal protein L12E/L44/L45/RPP1/RPP2